MSSNSSSANGIMNTATGSATKGAKKVAKKVVEEVAAAPVAAPAPAAAPAKKAAKAKAEAAPAPAPVAAPAPAAPAAEAAPAVEETRLEEEVKAVTTALLAVREQVNSLVTLSKKLEKRAAKLQKVADKRRRRQRPAEGAEGKPAKPSIFLVPTPLSNELCSFLGRPAGSAESRSNVTKAITTYVKENNLKNKHDITPDAKLRKLLNLKADDKLTYFNLQRYLNVHYLKADKPAATA